VEAAGELLGRQVDAAVDGAQLVHNAVDQLRAEEDVHERRRDRHDVHLRHQPVHHPEPVHAESSRLVRKHCTAGRFERALRAGVAQCRRRNVGCPCFTNENGNDQAVEIHMRDVKAFSCHLSLLAGMSPEA